MLVEDGYFSFRGLPQRGAACTTWFFAVGTVQAVVVLPFRNGPATPRTWRWGGVEFGMGVLKIIEIFHLERCRYNKFTSEFQHLQGAETLGKWWVFLKICSPKNWGAPSTLKLTCQTISPVLHQGQDGMSRDSGDRGCRRIGDAWAYLRIGVGWVGSKMGRAVGWRWHFWASKFILNPVWPFKVEKNLHRFICMRKKSWKGEF